MHINQQAVERADYICFFLVPARGLTRILFTYESNSFIQLTQSSRYVIRETLRCIGTRLDVAITSRAHRHKDDSSKQLSRERTICLLECTAVALRIALSWVAR